jgi:geranylgeranyl diphosphate synthase type II
MDNSGFSLTPYIGDKRALVDRRLAALVVPESGAAPRLAEAMQHSLNAGGKRLRPILCLAAYEAVQGAATEEVLTAACALELVHTYSLIHDDLPAMDDDQLRRGLPTCHVAFDEATAILAGDALLTMAFEVLSAAALESVLDPSIWMRAIAALASAAGHAGMVTGQMTDMEAEGRRLSLEELEHLHRLKTAGLIEAAVAMGCHLAQADADQHERLQHYARAIGLAFQVTDDILNVVGDPDLLGKAVGTDAARSKNTYPALLGLDGARRRAQDLVDEAITALNGFDDRIAPLRALAGYIIHRQR